MTDHDPHPLDQPYRPTPLQERLGLEPSEEVTLELLDGGDTWRATARIRDRDPASAAAWRGVTGAGVTAEAALAALHECLRRLRTETEETAEAEEAYGAAWWDNQIALHPPVNDVVRLSMDVVRARFRALGHVLFAHLPPGPDRTVALRALKEASMHAIGAIACNQDHR